ncbi:hypothetical protein ACHEXL_05515 [Limnohabitans sp. yimb22184]|uniref:hypothetical protein n=1 Tax=Limnohabitans sp. YIMB22184 TaxID=3374104 RepID=UPI003A88BA02
MDFTTLLIVAYFALLAINLRKRWGVIDGPWLFFFRAFFPNWKFYHGISPAPRLYVRAQSVSGGWSVWRLVYPRLPRQAWHLFHNPAVNLALTHQNLVDHLANDINDLPEGADIRDRVTYQLVSQLARQAVEGGSRNDQAVMAQLTIGKLSAYQFEIRMELPGSNRSDLMLQSPVLR